MADSPLSGKKIVALLANARQTIDLLKSQLRAGMVEQDYWMERLDDLGALMNTVTQEHATSDEQSRLAALYDVSRLIGSSLDLEEVLNQVMDAIIQLTGAERGFLMLFDEKGELEVKAARNLAKETLEEEEFAISRSVIRIVAETGEQVVTTDATEDPRFASQASVVAHSLRSIQCVPLRVRGKIIGVVYVDNRVRTGVFDEADLEMLSAFASQAAVAIENARLFTRTDEALAARVGELSIMQEIDRQLNETLDFSKVMNLTLDWAARVTHSDNGAIGLIDIEQEGMHIIAQHGSAPSAAVALLDGTEKANGTSGLTIPIQREGRMIGMIALEHGGEREYTSEHCDFLARLADHAAISIENARLYDAVQQANTAKTEFISTVTHELRIPMTSIKGYTEMIGMMGQLSEQQKSFLSIIRNNIDRMTVLVSDLSDISRIESGRLKLEIEDNVNLEHVVSELLPSMRSEIDQRRHNVKIDIPRNLPAVRTDPQRLTQILVNLISNAYKYTPNGGKIIVRARKESDQVRCEVTDTGVGMTSEEVGKLFTKFWRADDPHVREQPGTGLGLTIAKNLIELQGGELAVKSQKGSGTTFSFTLPLSG
ncbi:MAG: GAF domain-containing protein [Anaerolineae bacterium]|nr:GAF domain-containing protein [Anaerolineae bacterium]